MPIECIGVMMYVKDLNSGMKYVSLKVKVVKDLGVERFIGRYNKPRSVHKFLVADETGSIELKIWDRSDIKIKESDIVKIENAFVTSYQGKLMLNISTLGVVKRVGRIWGRSSSPK